MLHFPVISLTVLLFALCQFLLLYRKVKVSRTKFFLSCILYAKHFLKYSHFPHTIPWESYQILLILQQRNSGSQRVNKFFRVTHRSCKRQEWRFQLLPSPNKRHRAASLLKAGLLRLEKWLDHTPLPLWPLEWWRWQSRWNPTPMLRNLDMGPNLLADPWGNE